jgi:hypothetical protein
MQPQAAITTQVMREYRNLAQAQRDMSRMAAAGFTVVSTTQLTQRSGIMRILLIGIFAAVFHPKPHVLVTYSGIGTPPPALRSYGLLAWLLLWPLWVWSWRASMTWYRWVYRTGWPLLQAQGQRGWVTLVERFGKRNASIIVGVAALALVVLCVVIGMTNSPR